ncbi:MAG: hypothetical protein ACTSWQ_06320 [Candidatus Thorarchaeota archaeon]
MPPEQEVISLDDSYDFVRILGTCPGLYHTNAYVIGHENPDHLDDYLRGEPSITKAATPRTGLDIFCIDGVTYIGTAQAQYRNGEYKLREQVLGILLEAQEPDVEASEQADSLCSIMLKPKNDKIHVTLKYNPITDPMAHGDHTLTYHRLTGPNQMEELHADDLAE